MFLEVFREIHLVFPDVVQVIRTRIVCHSFPSMTPQKSQFCSWNLRFYLTNSHGCCFNKNAQQFPPLIQALSRLNPHVGSLRLQSHSVLVNVQGLCSCLTSFFVLVRRIKPHLFCSRGVSAGDPIPSRRSLIDAEKLLETTVFFVSSD